MGNVILLMVGSGVLSKCNEIASDTGRQEMPPGGRSHCRRPIHNLFGPLLLVTSDVGRLLGSPWSKATMVVALSEFSVHGFVKVSMLLSSEGGSNVLGFVTRACDICSLLSHNFELQIPGP